MKLDKEVNLFCKKCLGTRLCKWGMLNTGDITGICTICGSTVMSGYASPEAIKRAERLKKKRPWGTFFAVAMAALAVAIIAVILLLSYLTP